MIDMRVKEIFAKRLEELRIEKGKNQYEVADDLKIARSTYANWEQGKAVPKDEVLNRLADYFNVSIDYLLGRTNIREKVDDLIQKVALKRLPVYNSANAGLEGAYPDNHEIIDWIQIPENTNAECGVIVYGDSMEPEILDGDIVLINRNLEIKNNDRVLAIIGSPYFPEPLALVKVFKEAPDGKKYLVSLNPKYPPILLNGAEIKLVAKVVGIHRRYR